MREILSVTLLLMPAAYVWYAGRRLVERLEDPAFPELSFARRSRTPVVFALCLVAALALSLELVWLKVPLVILALLVAAFPARRRIHGETWGLGSYLWHILRFWLAMLGVWILMALIPALSLAAEPHSVTVLWITASLALLWGHLNGPLLPAILGARARDRSAFPAGFETILSAARCPEPRLLEATARGGRWVNAFALPFWRRPAVLFTTDLLDALTPDETTAIFAHEVAHLEYYDRRRMLRRELAAVALLVSLLAVLWWGGFQRAWIETAAWSWPVIVLLFLTTLSLGNRGREHQSDLRALELGGDPAALISALTKVHDALRLPRRWQANREARLSHPSLANRIRAIQERAGLAETVDSDAPAQPLVLRGADDPTTVVVLGPDRLHLMRRVPEACTGGLDALLSSAADCRSIRYADLRDLRLEVGATGRRQTLKALDADGRELGLRLASEDVAEVKARLARIDLQVQLTSPEASGQQLSALTRRRAARIWGVVTLALGLASPLSFPLVAASLLVLFRPAKASFAATAGIALAGAALALLRPATWFALEAPRTFVPLAQLAVAGILFFQLLRWMRQDNEGDRTAGSLTVGVLALLGLAYLLAGALEISRAPHLSHLHFWARHAHGLIALCVGLALTTAVIGRRTRERRRLMLAPVAGLAGLSAALLLIGGDWFGRRVSDDPLAAANRPLRMDMIQLEYLRDLELEGSVYDLRVSPSGSRLAMRRTLGYDDYSAQEGDFLVEAADGALLPIVAMDLRFVDDGSVAAIVRGEAGGRGALELRLLNVDSSLAVERAWPLPMLYGPRLRIDPQRRVWEVTTQNYETSMATLIAGSLDSPDQRTIERAFPALDDAYVSSLQLRSDGLALVIAHPFDRSAIAGLGLYLGRLFGNGAAEIWLSGDDGERRVARTALEPWCVEPASPASVMACLAQDRDGRARVLEVDPESGIANALGAVPGYFTYGELTGDGRLALAGYGRRPVLIDLSEARATELPLPGDTASDTATASTLPGWVSRLLYTPPSYPVFQALARNGDAIAIADYDRQGFRVVVYRIPAETALATRERSLETSSIR